MDEDPSHDENESIEARMAELEAEVQRLSSKIRMWNFFFRAILLVMAVLFALSDSVIGMLIGTAVGIYLLYLIVRHLSD